MGELDAKLLTELAYALGIGLFVGLEREHGELASDLGDHHVPEEHDRAAGETIFGVRTFALLSLLGWGCAHAGATWVWLPPVGLLAVAGLVVSQYFLASQHGRGLTTEVAAILVYVVFAIAIAVGGAIAAGSLYL